MSNEEMFKQVIAGAMLEALDLFELGAPDIQGVIARIGLRVSLKFQNGHAVETRRNGLSVMRSFYDIFKDQLTHWLPTTGGSPRKLTAGQVPPMEQPNALADVGAWYGCRLYGYSQGQAIHGPSLLLAHLSCVWNKQAAKNSSFVAHLPLSWCVENGFERTTELVGRWASSLRAVHGTAGISLLFEEDSAGAYIQHALFLLKKFPGLDYEDVTRFNLQVDASPTDGSKAFKIRAVSWLTLLGETIMNELGGQNAIKAALGPESTIFNYDGGAIIQAMPAPQLGRSEDGIVPEGYKKVAKLTKNVRFEGYSRGLFANLPPPLDNLRETLEWLRRFD